MFGNNYFAGTLFADRYYPPGGSNPLTLPVQGRYRSERCPTYQAERCPRYQSPADPQWRADA